MKRVTTVEGRASGRTILVGDTSHGKQSQLTDEKKPPKRVANLSVLRGMPSPDKARNWMG